MYTIEVKILTAGSIRRGVSRVQETAQTLSGLSTIPQIAEQQQLLSDIMTTEFWEQASVFDCEHVRVVLRELVKFIEKDKRKILNTHFNDTVISTTTSQGDLGDDDFMCPYNERVNEYVLAHLNNIVIHKIKTNQTLTDEDLKSLEMILHNEIGTKQEYEHVYHDTPLSKLIRSIVGLDQQVANDVFSEFLNDTSLDPQQTTFIKTIISSRISQEAMPERALFMQFVWVYGMKNGN